ncbi:MULTISPECIES: Gfo/Idh/MocA family oxidoreductase [unclassified Facklamia]|uniref:Gfo/Idh/MocA family protein n=1 Tax=Aerococcaceae TaxID=186827 RepID=UPI0013BCAF0E|nr:MULTISPECIES: Gfo/Idh/MocA family oxidoreductase [unclassified Facklamia]NEW64302.1 gfo/Idh/MocA family oxidoreductase [Facklamia sp. 252]NEW67861.1 gfo/Idh/MocA family oxidoreductase [Facklamia sp. 253]QQD64767.1 Gfo/Idh/MocA family oxidoreductase [Aerococcaceae bacterium zg-252]
MINVGIIGAGKIAAKMAKTIHGVDKANAYAIASRDAERALSFAETHGFKKAYHSYEALVRDENVDLVYVATPHNFHFKHAKLALENGKHVLCEKAITLNAKELTELIAIATERQLTFVEAIWSRFMPLHLQLKSLLDTGAIGEPQILYGNLSYYLEHVERMYNPHLAGGALLDLGVYPVHYALSLFGNDYQSIQSTMMKTELGVDRHTAITLQYADGKIAQLMCSMNAFEQSSKIYGTNGRIETTGIHHIEEIRVYDKENNCTQVIKRPNDIGGFEFELAETIKMIEEHKIESDIVTHADSLAVMQVLDTVRQQNDFIYPNEKVG